MGDATDLILFLDKKPTIDQKNCLFWYISQQIYCYWLLLEHRLLEYIQIEAIERSRVATALLKVCKREIT